MIGKRFFIFLLCLSSLLFIGCDSQSFEVLETFSTDDVSHIQVSIGDKYKNITENNDIKKIIDNLSSLYLEENNSRNKRGYTIGIKFFNHSGQLTENIELTGDNVVVNDKWYKTDISGIQLFEKDYLKMDYEVMIDKNKQEQIDWKIKQRNRSSMIDALKGTWAFENYSYVCFDENYLYQEGYKFKYKIENVDNKTLYISVFKSSSTLDEDEKLFDIIIEMDDAKTNAKFKKIITSVLTYKYNMIYVDSENDKLGSFESSFFEVLE